MKAIHVTRLDGPGAVELQDAPAPSPAEGEVLVEVACAGVTFPELLQTYGQYQTKHEPPFILGSELAGTVVESRSSRFAPGDRVAAIIPSGAFAQFATAPEAMVLPLPEEVSLEAAAGMPMNVLTADFALRTRGNLQPGQRVLIHGAAGGLGSACVQIALAMGAEVIAVVSSDEKAAMVTELGAQHVVRADGFKDAVKDIAPRGVDVVVDPVGGDRFTDSLRCLARFGTLLVLGFTAGSIPEVKVNRLLLNNISVAGVGWGAALPSDPLMAQKQWAHLREYLANGQLNPHIHARFSLDQAAAAITELENRSVIGKVILDIQEDPHG